tara:strand:+ start:112 stop:546 length:435 start_codon:yes stop_codon:yes gene_type:complete
MKIIGGAWLKIRDNYDIEMCLENGWECVQGRHYDALINKKKVEVKKSKSNSVIIKCQQLAEIELKHELSDIFYLYILTDKTQDNILEAIQIKALDLCKCLKITSENAKNIINVHEEFKCTIQTTISISKIKKQCNFESYQVVTK